MVRRSHDKQEEPTILVRGARQLLTLRGPNNARRGAALHDLGVIPNGALLIRGGKILQAGPSSRLENLAVGRRAREIDAAGRVVMPGFVDCGADLILPHPPLAAYEKVLRERRPAEQPEPAEEFWRAAHEIRTMPARRMESRARLLASGMVRHGTVTVGTKSGHGLDDRAT